MNFDWDDLRHFLALAERQSLAAAAEAMRSSPVTVMRRVKSLEDALGATLFIRRRDGHRLTESGSVLLNIARDAQIMLNTAADAVAARNDREAGEVRIATTEIAANHILLPALPAFLAAHPEIAIRIDSGPGVADLLESEAAVALRFNRPLTGDFVIRRLGGLRFSCYATEAAREDCGIVWTGDFEGIAIDRAIRLIGYRRTVGLDSFAGHLAACRSGLGAAILPDFVAQRFAELRRLGDGPTLDAWLVVSAQHRKTRRVQLVASFVAEAFDTA